MLTTENLKPLLSAKTELVTCPHASNVLGTIHDVKKIAEMVHSVPGAKLCVDGVALAPHREVDVKALGVDFYAFSWYKVRNIPGMAVSLSLVVLLLTLHSGLWSPYSDPLRLPVCPRDPWLSWSLFPHRH